MNYLKISTDVGQSLADAHGLQSSLQATLDVARRYKLFARGYIILQNSRTANVLVGAAEGLSATEFRRLENRLEKNFVKSFFETGELRLVENVSAEPFFDFVHTRAEKIHFVGAPIIINRKTVGCLAVEIAPLATRELQDFIQFLKIVAAMISQTLKVQTEIAGEREKLAVEISHLQKELRERYDFGNLIGNSNAMRAVHAQIAQVARSNAAVLLRGESGTGKNLVARALHYNSLRTKKPFVRVDCAALPADSIEAELFGVEKGAFGATKRRRKGRFEFAEAGTLLLDEIGDLSAPAQSKLLRVLRERHFERLGGTEAIKVNVRLIAAASANLERKIADDGFQADLFDRLSVFTIFLPPLRERKSDVLLLAEHFLEKYARVHDKPIRRISTPAIDMLTAYHYPGNVRELENAIERAVLACDENVVHGHHLPPTLQTAEISDTLTKLTLDAAVAVVERDLIQDALKTTGGNCAQAALLLDTTERIVNYKIAKYAIDPKRFRRSKNRTS